MSEQVKLPKGVETYPVRVCECGAIHDRPEAGCPGCGSVIARAAGEAIYVSDLPAIIAQRDVEWREGLLGDEAVEAVARNRWPLWIAMKPEQKAAALKATRTDLKTALDKAAPDGGGGQ